MELTQFRFTTESYAFIQHKVCTFAETGGKFDKTEPSLIVNLFKNDDAGKRGRKKKVNVVGTMLTTQDIAHYTRNIAIYLDFRLEDVARFTAYLFKDWYPDGDFLSITKAAAKYPESGLIKTHEDIEAYITEQGWVQNFTTSKLLHYISVLTTVIYADLVMNTKVGAVNFVSEFFI